MLLRKTFAPKREEVTPGCRNMLEGKLYKSQSSSGVIREIKSRSVRGAGHKARMGGGGRIKSI
jgi:hypothetical protein